MTVNVTTPDYRKGREDGMREAARIALSKTNTSIQWSDYGDGYNDACDSIASAIEAKAKEIRE